MWAATTTNIYKIRQHQERFSAPAIRGEHGEAHGVSFGVTGNYDQIISLFFSVLHYMLYCPPLHQFHATSKPRGLAPGLFRVAHAAMRIGQTCRNIHSRTVDAP
jgi:hypothetical protein